MNTDLQRLYEWMLNKNREPATTYFTEGQLRKVAKEFEFHLHYERKLLCGLVRNFGKQSMNGEQLEAMSNAQEYLETLNDK